MQNETLILTNSYWDMLKSLRDEVKLRLATRLTASVIEKEKSGKEYTEKMLDKFFGAWVDDRSTEEIMHDIKSHCSSKEPVAL